MSPEPTPPGPAFHPRISFERLRERTDELELIISGLTTVALFSLPGWLIEQFFAWLPSLPLALQAGANAGVISAVGLAYSLGTLFALHLAIRAYWIGLIGLKSVFPAGIQWHRITGTGPILRERLRQRIPDIDSAIETADRAASLLFAGITLAALSTVWIGLILILLFVGTAPLAAGLGISRYAFNAALLIGVVLVFVGNLLGWGLDVWLERRLGGQSASPFWRRLVILLGAANRLLLPERLISPLMLTLQSNTRPKLFVVVFSIAMCAVPLIGSLRVMGSLKFDLFQTHRYFDDTVAATAMRSRNYLSLGNDNERVRAWPSIPSPEISGRWLPVFLPYNPVRDDALLDQLCRPQALESAACLTTLWQLKLNGRPISLDGFFLAERRDLGFRGLQGYVALAGLKPGLQQLQVTWNPRQIHHRLSSTDATARNSTIPFLWTAQ